MMLLLYITLWLYNVIHRNLRTTMFMSIQEDFCAALEDLESFQSCCLVLWDRFGIPALNRRFTFLAPEQFNSALAVGGLTDLNDFKI